MELTLERWRWLPDEYHQSPIVVNIPEFRLRAYDDQFKIKVTMKVVVGKAYGHNNTDLFEQMRYVIFRPNWKRAAVDRESGNYPKLAAGSCLSNERRYGSGSTFTRMWSAPVRSPMI